MKHARWEIAAAGGHNVLMIGRRFGQDEVMLARRMPTILPPLSRRRRWRLPKIHSVAGNMAAGGLLARRPSGRRTILIRRRR